MNPLDSSKLYPYLVPASYPDTLDPFRRRELGHGIFVALVQDQSGTVRSVKAEELQAAKLSLDEAYARALTNEEGLMRKQEIHIQLFQEGPDGPHSFWQVVIGTPPLPFSCPGYEVSPRTLSKRRTSARAFPTERPYYCFQKVHAHRVTQCARSLKRKRATRPSP